jgi:hypothetical protein
MQWICSLFQTMFGGWGIVLCLFNLKLHDTRFTCLQWTVFCCVFCVILCSVTSYCSVLLCFFCVLYCSLLFILLPYLRFYHPFSSGVRQIPGYNSQRQGTARTSQILLSLYYVYSLRVNVWCKKINLHPENSNIHPYHCIITYSLHYDVATGCVNVWCTVATGCQPNVWCTVATGCQPNEWCTVATGCQPNEWCTVATGCVNVWCTAATGCVNVWCTVATGCQPNVWCTVATGCQPNEWCTEATAEEHTY